jgi:hypothetical protein
MWVSLQVMYLEGARRRALGAMGGEDAVAVRQAASVVTVVADAHVSVDGDGPLAALAAPSGGPRSWGPGMVAGVGVGVGGVAVLGAVVGLVMWLRRRAGVGAAQAGSPASPAGAGAGSCTNLKGGGVAMGAAKEAPVGVPRGNARGWFVEVLPAGAASAV